MKVSGFTFVRNGTLLGYPYIESILSALPLCDEFIIAVGESKDNTLKRIRDIGDPKIKIIETVWNECMVDRGYVYGQQKMIAHFNCTGDWAFYLEADEVLHENDIPRIRSDMEKHLHNHTVEALVFDYYHFYGSPDTIAVSPGWYRRAPRIIRNSIRSYSPDGLFFVIMDKNKRGRYPRAALLNAHIYHYGHVRSIEKMREKGKLVSRYWGHEPPDFNGYGDIDPQAIKPFHGKHPKVASKWLTYEAEQKFSLNPDYTLSQRERRHRWMMRLERIFGLELSKKHYRLVKAG